MTKEEREKIEEATELIIEKVKANDIDGVKRIIRKTYEQGMDAVWPWLLVNVDGDIIVSAFGIDHDYTDLTEDAAVGLFEQDCEKEVEYIIESMVRPGDEENDKNEELDAAISEYLTRVHLRNRCTGDDFYFDTHWKLHRTKYQLEKSKMTKKKQTDRPVDDSESYDDLPF